MEPIEPPVLDEYYATLYGNGGAKLSKSITTKQRLLATGMSSAARSLDLFAAGLFSNR